MAYVIKQFSNPIELQDYLNGVILSRDLEATPTLDLTGKTLIINDGGDHTVTFVGLLTPNAIVAAINAVVSSAVQLRNYGHTAPPRSALAFSLSGLKIKSTGTANALLGLPTSGGDLTVGAGPATTDIVAITEGYNRFTIVHV
jgi:hypothetical protein